MSEGIVRRCAHCAFVMQESEPYVVTAFGYCHLTCACEEDQ